MMMGGRKRGHNLPPEYQEVEYLQSQGNEYIDVNLKLQNVSNFSVICDWECLSTKVNTAAFGFYYALAYHDSPSLHNFRPYWNAASKDCRFQYSSPGAVQPTNFVGTDTYLTRNITKVINNVIFINDVPIINGGSSLRNHAYDSNRYAPFLLFASASNNDIYSASYSYYNIEMCGVVRIYSFEYHDNTGNRRIFVPCYRKYDNKAGMYDLAESICLETGTPFYTTVSGSLITGPIVI